MKTIVLLVAVLAIVRATEVSNELEVDVVLSKTAETSFGQNLLTQLKSSIQDSVDAGGPIDKLLKLIDDVRQKTLKDAAHKKETCAAESAALISQIQSVEQTIAKNKASIQDFTVKVQQETSEVQGQDNRARSLIHATQQLDTKIEDVNRELIQGGAKFEDEKSALEKQMAEIKGLIELLKNIAVKLATNNMVEQAAEIKAEANHAAEKAAKSGSSSVQLAAALLQTAAVVDSEAEVEGDMNDFKKLLAMLRSELEKNLRDLEAELASLSSSWNSNKLSLEKERSSLQGLLSQSKSELSTSQKLKGQALSRLSDSKKEISQLKPFVVSLQNQVSLNEKHMRDNSRECAAAAQDFAKQLKVLDDIEKMLRLKHKTLSKGLLNKIENVDLPPVWVQGPWGPCQARCGTGVSVRTVTCSSTTHACPHTKPITRRPCFEHACPTKAPLSFLDEDDADKKFDEHHDNLFEAELARGNRDPEFLKKYQAWQSETAEHGFDGVHFKDWLKQKQDLHHAGQDVGIATVAPTTPTKPEDTQ
eukprot:TRINITY_DN151_c0_g1_i1.p1 TRINITY_DN151_c0_g1~~TRINITY_DN151_c0_g1_i1.p1  ORF type:complete len:552 (-),score=264.42 TRINITY_DN151_c0_g1_i1:107-1702(-)